MKEPEESREARRQREKEAERRREALLREIEELILTNYLQALALPAVRRAIEQRRRNFFFANDYAAGRQIDRLLGTMVRRLNGLMLNGIRWEWAQSAADLQRRVEGTLTDKEYDSRMRDLIRYQARQSSRQHSADAFVQEKQRDGLNLSGRVWNLAGNAKREIEVILQNAIIEGKRGTEIAHSLREYLQEPGRLFRRVRNPETGQLELSQAARAYHPGHGVYRSAYKNALRLARTELKAAQCEAAWQSARWNPLIVGWEIRLSNNHTTLRDGKPCPFHDMCDELQGTYPKAFRFRGWHPHCRCEMLPIIAGREDRRELYRRIFKGDARERASWSPRAVEEVPQAFTDWVEKNRERARGWRTVPRFIRDNPAYVVGEYGRPKPRPVELPPGFLDFEDPRKPKKTEKVRSVRNPITKEQRERRSEIKKIVFGRIPKNESLVLRNDAIDKPIRLYKSGVGEWLNQPHTHYSEKNEALLVIDRLVKEAVYLGGVEDKHSSDVTVHVFEVSIANEKSWLVVREFKNGDISLHSVSDNPTLANLVKKRRPL